MHDARCTICRHPKREEIETEFCEWQSPSRIAKQFKVNYRSLYRHSHAVGLFDKRERNLRGFLTDCIVKAKRNKVTVSQAIQAAALLAKIDSTGKSLDRTQDVGLLEAIRRMSNAELEELIEKRTVPEDSPLRDVLSVNGGG